MNMRRALLSALLTATVWPAAAQDAAQPPASPLSRDQIVAFNKAVVDFTAGQKAQQGGDSATALAKYEAALPAIRDAVRAQPINLDYVNFLANTLYAAAGANALLQKIDALNLLYEESLPHWQKIVEAKPTDATSRMVLAGILTQLGNVKLTKQDKAGAAPLHAEAAVLARRAVAEKADSANRNLLLSALIGLSQTGTDEAIKAEVAAMSKAMLADNSVSDANRPAALILSGAPAAR
jgi:tetratricopeptide (TPR) repeat protein